MNYLNKFIEDELAVRRKHYKEDPASIIEHYNIEQQNIQTYNGRQLLEMLQNADDASESARDKKVLIKLNGNKLIICNNGESFNEEGYLSITRSNISPKTMQQNKIGQKGLGFRSILSWADHVEINSGGIKLGFSRKIAQTFLQNLIEEKSQIADFIKKTSKSKYPVATLRVPQLINDVKDTEFNFDTVITLNLKENIKKDVQSQIHTVINKETLIFLNHIEEIEVDSPERKIIFKKSVSENRVTIESNDLIGNIPESKTWNLNKISGEHIYVENSETKSKNYELVIAWNDELNDRENVIFSYFKTQVRFPFPALLHGTFELTQNRNQLENDTYGHNQFLTDKLTDLLIDTALKIASKEKEATYLPLKLLNIDFETIDGELINFNFKEKLIKKIKSNAVFPTVNGEYISYNDEPVFYESAITSFLSGIDVANLMISEKDKQFIQFLENLNLCYYTLKYFLRIISTRTDNHEHVAKLLYHALTYEQYRKVIYSEEFNLTEQAEFLIDNEDSIINWTSTIFIQPHDEIEFKLPKSLSVRFLNPDLVIELMKEFDVKDNDDLIEILEPFQIKKYSFSEISETLIRHYTGRRKLQLEDVKELHSFLFRLFKNETKNGKPVPISVEISTPVISSRNRISSSNEVYFGNHYGNNLTENLYRYNKSKLLAEKKTFGLEKTDIKIVKEYFIWLGIAELPRYKTKKINTNKQDSYVESLLRSFKYPTVKWGYSFKNYDELNNWLPWSITLSVGEFDDLDKILTNSKPENIFDWIKQDKELKETLEKDRETHNDSHLYCYYRTERFIYKADMCSYTKWKIATTSFLPVESGTYATPEKCCLSKTITSEFSPFVEKPKIAISEISEKLLLSEDVIESYLTLLGVHREISSLSIDVLYGMLYSLMTSDFEGKVAKTIYREIINNFNENKLDPSHPAYKKFIEDGKVLCQRGNELGYFNISDAFYIETKTFGNNILKRFPLVCIDRKRGNKKVERLFGVKSLDNISFRIIGEPKIHSLNQHFIEEIHRFKALIYTLRMHQDTKDEIKRNLKRLKIILIQDIKAEFIHNQIPQKFELEPYEFIVTKSKSNFYILIPENVAKIEELKQNNMFCDSISEIFTTLINTEEYRDFIHDLYSKREIDREPRLLSSLQQDSNELIIQARKKLEIIDDIRISFWNAFSIASGKKIKSEIRNEKELNHFLSKKLKLGMEKLDKVSSVETFIQLSELSNQEFIYQLFLEFNIDFIKFTRHFSGLDFTDLFKNKIEDLKSEYRNDFSFHLYNKLKEESSVKKGEYFNSLDDYNELTYSPESGFVPNIEQYFKALVNKSLSIKLQNKGSTFSIQKLMNDTLISLTSSGIEIPSNLRENKRIQALLIFNETEEIKREIEIYVSSVSTQKSNQIRVRGKTIDYEDFQSLAKQVLEGLNISRLKLKISKTIPIEERHRKGSQKRIRSKDRKVRFNTKNEEQIGFIAELICYHKFCEKYGEENINWVSENAYRAYPEKFMISEAGKGYDLEFKDENGRVRYVEIKGIVNIEDGIHMSKTEMQTAIEFPDKYDLLIVENPLNHNPSFRHIKSPFKFKSEETLFSNRKFKVFNDNYLIRFKWDE